MRIAFAHNLKTADDEAQAEFDTPETIHALRELLRSLGHEVHLVDVTGPVSRLVARLETLRPDLVFNTAEGTHGAYREAFYPSLFEQLQLPYTGSGPQVCAVTLDKQATKALLHLHGVPTPRWELFSGQLPPDGALPELTFPVIVKPNFEGSSKGVTRDSIVYEPERLRGVLNGMLERFGTGVLVEEFIVGQDVTVPYLETVGVLTPASYELHVEGVEDGYEIYDYALKNHDWQQVEVTVPAPLPATTMEALRVHTATVMQHLGVRDMGRADYRVTRDGRIYFIEVNALPSLEPGASLYESAKLHGLATPAEVLAEILESATRRQAIADVSARAGALRVGLAHNLQRVDPKSGDDTHAEFDSPRTVAAISRAIEALGHEVVRLEATPDLPRNVAEAHVDVVFNIAEGMRGRTREAQVPALLDLLGIPYTGSDAATLAITLDKGLAKRIVQAAGVATPRWVVVPPGGAVPTDLRLPVIVKPNAEGSSKGIGRSAVVTDAGALAEVLASLHARFHAGAIVEEFLVGREFTVGVLGDATPMTLPIMEICFDDPPESLPIYTFDHKTEVDLSVHNVVPAPIDEALAARIRELALTCFDALGCRDVARVDVRLDGAGEPNFIECNPLPGLSPGYSDLCIAAEAAEIDHGALIARILAPAVRRLALERDGEGER